jgi:hypothetical protein
LREREVTDPRAPEILLRWLQRPRQDNPPGVDLGVKGVKTAAYSGCGSVVLVDEAAEAIAPVEMAVLRQLCRLGMRRMECESAVGALAVVVPGVGP